MLMTFYNVLGRVHEGVCISARRKSWEHLKCVFFCEGKMFLLLNDTVLKYEPTADDILADDWE